MYASHFFMDILGSITTSGDLKATRKWFNWIRLALRYNMMFNNTEN